MDRVSYRLTNLSQADISPILPLPILPQHLPSSASALQDTDTQADIHPDNSIEDFSSTALKVAQLLHSTDISYLSIRDKQKSAVTPQGQVPGALAAAVLAHSPHAFRYEPQGPRKVGNGGLITKSGSSSQAAAVASPQTAVHRTPIPHRESPLIPVATPRNIHDATPQNAEPPPPQAVQRKRRSRQPANHMRGNEQIAVPKEKKATSEFIVKETCAALDDMFDRLEVTEDPDSSGELLTAQDLKQLYDQLLKLRLLLAALPLPYVTKLLILLDRHVQHGRDMDITDVESVESVKYQNIMIALEAAQVALTLMNAPGMPKQAYNEELIESLVEMTRYQTMHNVFPHFDAAYRLLHGERQDENEGEEDDPSENAVGGAKRRKSKSSPGIGRGRKSTGPKTSRIVTNVCNKLVTTFGALGELLVNTRLQDNVVLQLNRVMLATFGVENIQVLQQKALNIVCIIFEHYPQHRSTVMDEVVSLFWKMPASKRNLRAFHFKEDDKQIQMITALILQLVQSCVTLPSLSKFPPEVAGDTLDPEQKVSAKGYDSAVDASTYFWKQVLGRWGAGKQEGTDAKGLVENLVQDLLTSLNVPEFPGANLLLQIMCMLLITNTKDVSVRCMAIDLLGLVAAHLKEDSLKACNDNLWILTELKGRSHDSEGDAMVGGKAAAERRGTHDRCTVCGSECSNPIMLTCDGCNRRFHTDCIDVSEHEILGREWLCHSCACRKQLGALRAEAAKEASTSGRRQMQDDSCSSIGRGSAMTMVAEGGGDDGLAVVQQLLLNYLHWAGKSDLLATYAGRFYLCQWYRDESQVQGSLDFYHQRWRFSVSEHDSTNSSSLRSRKFISRICRALGQQHALARAFDKILEWILASLLEAAPTPRAKALKAVGTIVEVDPTILTDERVQKSVEGRFLDSAISVREAAIDLVGKHIVNRPDFALQYYERIAERMMDTGLSVRKRVIKTIRDVCIRNPGFAKMTDACVRIISRISDDEASIQELVTKTFQELWFDDLRGGSGHRSPLDVNAVPPEIADRTQQIVNVLRGLPNNGSLVAIIKRSLLGEGSSGVASKQGPSNFGAHAGVRRRCQQMCNCLLESILKAEESTTQEADAQALPFVLALHAFCTVDPTLCAPSSDPSRFAVTLQPYLKSQVAAKDSSKDSSKMLQNVVFVIDGVLPLLRRPSQTFVDELERDLKTLIIRDPRLAVVNACIKCLCSLRKVATSGLQAFDSTAKKFFEILNKHRKKTVEDKDKANVMRSLFALGLLCRFGTEGIVALESSGITLAGVAEIYRDYLRMPDFQLKMRALQASGFVFIAKPDLMLGKEDQRVLQASLSKGSDWRLKLQTLMNFYLYLSDVEERMAESVAGKDAAALAEEHRTGAVPVAAGAGDQNNICGGIIQLHWEPIKECLLDFNAEVRQQAAKVTEVVLRQGLVHPMTSVPHLIALGVDSQEGNFLLAHKMLAQLYTKYPSFVEGKVGEGLQLAFTFQECGAASSIHTPTQPTPPLSSAAAAAGTSAGITRVYKLVRSSRTSRNKFLSSILRKFDVCNSTNTSLDIPFLEYCANLVASLPFGVPDEPLYIVHNISRTIVLRAGSLISAMKDRITGEGPLAATVAATVREMRAQRDEDLEAAYDVDETEIFASDKRSTHTTTPDDLASAPPIVVEQMQADCKAAMALSLLLLLKQYLKVVYNLSDQRCQQYSPTEQLRPGDILQRRDSDEFETTLLPLDPPGSIHQMLKQYQVFKKLAKVELSDLAEFPTSTPARRGRVSGVKATAAAETPGNGAAAATSPSARPSTSGKRKADRDDMDEDVERGEKGDGDDVVVDVTPAQRKRRTSASGAGGSARDKGRPRSSLKKQRMSV